MTSPSSTRSKSSKKTLISDDKLERSAYFPDVANMKFINILEPKNETQTSYLEDDLEMLFSWLSRFFWFRFEGIFLNGASEEKESIDYKLLSIQILTPSNKTSSFLQKCGNLHNFLTTVVENKSFDNVKILQIRFLEDLMNGFKVYKKFNKAVKKSD